MLFLHSTAKAACLASLFLLPYFSSALEVAEIEVDSPATPKQHPLKRHNEFVVLEGHKKRENYHSPLPYTYIQKEDLPVSLWRVDSVMTCDVTATVVVLTLVLSKSFRTIGIGAILTERTMSPTR